MTFDAMPKGITRGYSNAFLTMIGEAAAKALTIKDLEHLDDADLERATSIAADNARIDSGHEHTPGIAA